MQLSAVLSFIIFNISSGIKLVMPLDGLNPQLSFDNVVLTLVNLQKGKEKNKHLEKR